MRERDEEGVGQHCLCPLLGLRLRDPLCEPTGQGCKEGAGLGPGRSF